MAYFKYPSLSQEKVPKHSKTATPLRRSSLFRPHLTSQIAQSIHIKTGTFYWPVWTLSTLLLPLYCDWKQKPALHLKSKKSDLDIVEHSMCHPGLPFPQGEVQDSSWGLAAFHRAKSLPCRLSVSTAKNKWFINGICLKERKKKSKLKWKCVFSELLRF